MIVGAASSGVLTCQDAHCCRQPGLRLRCRHCKAVAEFMQTIKDDTATREESENLSEELDTLTALAAGFEGLLLSADAEQVQPGAVSSAKSLLPQSRIDPDSRHHVMRTCSQHGYGMQSGKCMVCLVCGAVTGASPCRWYVTQVLPLSSAASRCQVLPLRTPVLGTPANICTKCCMAPGDDRDPVAEGWVTQRDCLLISQHCRARHCILLAML